jgi:hypothetical protein
MTWFSKKMLFIFYFLCENYAKYMDRLYIASNYDKMDLYTHIPFILVSLHCSFTHPVAIFSPCPDLAAKQTTFLPKQGFLPSTLYSSSSLLN